MKARKKQINDRFDHMAGDEAIVFVMEAEERDSQILLTRLRERLAENNQSMSIGVITFDAITDVSIDDIIARADDSMYAEKRTRPGTAKFDTNLLGEISSSVSLLQSPYV